MTRWLVHEQRECPGGTVRERGLELWDMRHPVWIEEYRKAGGDGRDGREALVRWITRGSDRVPDGTTWFDTYQAARWAFERQPMEPGRFGHLRAWAEDWTKVKYTADAAVPLSDELRVACARACWSRSGEREAIPGADALLSDAVRWRESLGGAGALLRTFVAARFLRLGLARESWREALRVAGISRARGLARLGRTAFPTGADFIPLLRQAALEPADACRMWVLQLVQSWWHRRLWDVWRRHRSSDAETELGLAGHLLEQVADRFAGHVAFGRLRAGLLAHAGRLGGVRAALRMLRECDSRASETAASVAIAFGLRDDTPGAKAVIDDWPETSGDAPVLWFMRAVEAQLRGDTAQAARALAILHSGAPDFFGDTASGGARWVLTAIVFQRAGKTATAMRLRTIVSRVTPGGEVLLDDAPAGRHPLAAGWSEFFGT
jgi:hypothetical protein